MNFLVFRNVPTLYGTTCTSFGALQTNLLEVLTKILLVKVIEMIIFCFFFGLSFQKTPFCLVLNSKVSQVDRTLSDSLIRVITAYPVPSAMSSRKSSNLSVNVKHIEQVCFSLK